MPFYHCFGMVMGNLGCVSHGATMVIPAPAFDPAATLRCIEAERCTAVYGVPTMFIAMQNHSSFASTDLGSLRTGLMAGSPCPVEVMKRCVEEMHLAEVGIAYGMTETSPVSCQTRIEDDLERRTSTIGRAHPHVEIKIVDPASGETLERGEPGEFCTRGYSVMLGYWEDPEKTAAAVDTDGWMHTGDLATMGEARVGLPSRLTGLLRVMVFGYVIGEGALADVYLIGNETPNIVYELLIGGVLSATLVPLFTEFLETDDNKATNAVITVSLTAMAVLTAFAVLAAPLIFGLYTVNTHEGVDPELIQRVGTLLTRVFLIQIFFYGAAGLANAVLNSRRRFLAAAWSPVLANLVVIVTLLSLPDRTWQLADVEVDERLRWTLAIGSTAGIAVMALVLIPALRSAGLHFRPAWKSATLQSDGC